MRKFIIFICLATASIVSAAQWDIVEQDDDCIYTAVYFINDSVGFAIGNCGFNGVAIKKTTDYGTNWNTVYVGSNDLIHDIYFPSDTIGYCSTHENVLKTIDGGETWFYPTPEFQGYPYRSIVFEDEMIGFGCFTDNGAAFARTIDGGYTWIEEYEYGGREIIKIGDCQYRMVEGYYHKSDNCWAEHESIALPIDDRYDENIAYSDNNIVLSCGLGYSEETNSNFGFLGKSADDGQNWQIQDFSVIYALRSIVFANSSIAYCVGQAYSPNPYSFLKTIDGGVTWHYQEYEFPCDECYAPDVRDVYCPSENVCYAVSGSGAIWRTTNGGGPLYELPVGVQEQTAQRKMSVYPNPVSNELSLSGILPREKPTIKISDTTGRLVMTDNNPAGNGQSGTGKQQIDVSQLPSGIYFIEVSTELSRAMLRFIKE